eukprot:CAMPEP_0114554758 /NCGR_PEP_ID=MMETSP0114-20121206/8383_1 /TAXON_ID=31324 /ORGANISM="Goniomonas sp, Strain m" /LENGTH=992 /DNA_ID=CAMNT_0001739831 /DNA_START=20 /DNA_END=2998 /DNA_ORIENTATION=-
MSRMLGAVLSLGARTKVAHRGAFLTRRLLATSAVAKGSFLQPLDTFPRRHLGPSDEEAQQMLQKIGLSSLKDLVKDTVPAGIVRAPLEAGNKEIGSEQAALAEIKAIASKNKVLRSFIGMGYYGNIVPPVILRNVLENPAWYTPYTPYQAEVSQGRMESLLNFQTMVVELTGLPYANASLLDESTAAAEAMTLCHAAAKNKKPLFFISNNVHPQTIDVVKTRAAPLGIEIVVGDHQTADLRKACGALLQYPATDGGIQDYTNFSAKAHELDCKVVMATDLLALTVLKTPGEMGADIVLGNSQRFGVPFGYGGPHAAFFAVIAPLRRLLPGRIIGVTRDRLGNRALRLALQTREQHIKREKATSNICTAQALLANTAAMYAIYHGPQGLTDIALRVNGAAQILATGLRQLGHAVADVSFFDTVRVDFPDHGAAEAVMQAAISEDINVRRLSPTAITISLDETVGRNDLAALFRAFNSCADPEFTPESLEAEITPGDVGSLRRTSSFMQQPVFNENHTETEMLRYIFHLASKDLGLQHAMISLGSCTMKLNATAEMIPITWPEFNQMHPFVPVDQAGGYTQLVQLLHHWLCDITGFVGCSLQPNSGASGEYAGLKAIQRYHQNNDQGHRNVCIIPVSAHGTNPASAAMLGLQVVVVPCDALGNIDIPALRAAAEKHKDHLASLMITYPSTHGVFELGIREMIDIIHENGGLVYMDGANMNAQVGLTSPGEMGADVCHLNLHKTFCIPHGGGGPGVGPICCNEKLLPFLPSHSIIPCGGDMGAVAGAPFGSAGILPISWMYIRMMGGDGLTKATQTAILNANYLAASLKDHYKILYKGNTGRVAHEFIIDLRGIKTSCGISETDIAKRLIDYGFHAPTMSFPVSGTLMVEPTESESKEELDRFVEAMVTIRAEITAIEEGRADKNNNVLKNAPHTMADVSADVWDHPYSREEAAYPVPALRLRKQWPTVARADDVYGDRNLFCTCDPIEVYMEQS